MLVYLILSKYIVRGIALGSVMSDGVFHNISGSYYALGFYDDGSAVMGKPDLRISAETDYDSFSISAMNYIRQTSFGIFMYDDSFNDLLGVPR